MSERDVHDVLSQDGPLSHGEIHDELPHLSTGGLDRILEPMVERGELSWQREDGGEILYDTSSTTPPYFARPDGLAR